MSSNRSVSSQLIPYVAQVSSEEFVRSEVERRVDKVYMEVLGKGVQEAQKEFAKIRGDQWKSSEVLVAKGDQVVLHECSSDISIDTQYMIGSVSKQFFAVALLKAIYEKAPQGSEEEKAKYLQAQLKKPVSDFLSENASIWAWNKGRIPEWAKVVSLHQLLSHTSGIPNYMEVSLRTNDWHQTGKKFHELPHSASDVIELISDQKFSPPGKFQYSNTNYRIISELIGSISGMPISDYLEKKFFIPLNMKSTASPVQGRSDQLRAQSRFSKLAKELQFDQIKKTFNPSSESYFYEDIGVAIGDGSIVSTAKDLVKWNHALHKTKSVLPDVLYKMLIEGHSEEEGILFGFGINKNKEGSHLSHTGLISSYSTELHYMPKQDLSVIVLSSVASSFSVKEEEEARSLLKEEVLAKEPRLSEIECKEKIQRLFQQRYPNHTDQLLKILDVIPNEAPPLVY